MDKTGYPKITIRSDNASFIGADIRLNDQPLNLTEFQISMGADKEEATAHLEMFAAGGLDVEFPANVTVNFQMEPGYVLQSKKNDDGSVRYWVERE